MQKMTEQGFENGGIDLLQNSKRKCFRFATGLAWLGVIS